MATTQERIKSLFADLGKPTLRGVKKCPKCGTLNGTRGLSCKNKECNTVFRDKVRKAGHSADAVRIITGSTVQVFSVRLRDRGPDYRGFVQLPLTTDADGNPTQTVDGAALIAASGAGRCFVETCQRVRHVNVGEETCSHIKLALSCEAEATPLTLKNSVLNSLNISNEIKQAIWLLATETTGPLVQRVTKNIMVVKCKPDPRQPLGFLHFSFSDTSRNRDAAEHKFHCTCRMFKTVKMGNQGMSEQARRCVHFYACICAFASDDKLTEEFAYYINLDNPGAAPEKTLELIELADGSPKISKKRKKDDTLAQASSALLTLQDSGNIPSKKTPIKKTAASPPSAKRLAATIDETEISLSFQEWLGSVVERINQTMHYQFDGYPDPLVFHVPQPFFDALQQRISAGCKKRRLPNSTVAFVRKDALPLGTFSKYTWHITNILHVKQIFDTPLMPLEVTRSFVENRDGTYEPYDAPKVEVETIAEAYRKIEGQQAIKPFELKTYLKVGNTSPDQKEPTPFVIEWIPDILPKCKIGELRIKFEYGHQRNGHMEVRRPVAIPEVVEPML
ncbi:uncharacterized protein C2orf42-like [Branchiostoma lanceolatum]|uniref:C2orf42 protein n=1 Tax=Branchiostoma lanceolatum TaxID=7740 RepID=A0A8J9ZME5_BRALA|nr:C2orf42 [Branchiostoma lanceolatum]